MDKDQAIADLKAALRYCIENHCPNDRLFCGACTPARQLLERLDAPPGAPALPPEGDRRRGQASGWPAAPAR